MNKTPLVTPTVLHPVPVHSPWYHVGIDFVGPIHPTTTNGNRYILTVLIILRSGWRLYHCPPNVLLESQKLCLRYLFFYFSNFSLMFFLQIFMRMGLPKLLTSDQGREFKNQLDQNIMKLLGIKHHFTTA